MMSTTMPLTMNKPSGPRRLNRFFVSWRGRKKESPAGLFHWCCKKLWKTNLARNFIESFLAKSPVQDLVARSKSRVRFSSRFKDGVKAPAQVPVYRANSFEAAKRPGTRVKGSQERSTHSGRAQSDLSRPSGSPPTSEGLLGGWASAFLILRVLATCLTKSSTLPFRYCYHCETNDLWMLRSYGEMRPWFS